MAPKKRKRVAKRSAAKVEAEAAAEAADADVDSDAEDSDEAPARKAQAPAEDDEDDFFETPDEKRVRVAKEYLRSIDDGAGGSASAVQERLEKDVSEQQRRARVQVRNVKLGEPRYMKGHKETCTCVALSQDERSLYSGGKDCAILRWDVETGKKDVFPGGRNMFDSGGHFQEVLGVSLIESRNLLASVGADRLVRFWDWRCPTGSACTKYLFGHTGAVTCVAADPDGTQVYSGAQDKSLKVWDLRGMRCSDTLFGHVQGLTSMDIYMKGRPVTGGTDKTIRVWKVDKDTHLMFSKHTYSVDAVAALDAERCVSGSQDGRVMLWTHASKKPVATAAAAPAREWITALGAIRSGNVFFSGSTNNQLRTWQAVPGAPEADGKKASMVLEEAAPAVELPGCLNAITVGKRVVACAIGKDHRLGGWYFNKRNRNGVVLLPLSYEQNSSS
eukprot:TRINITY_DN63668_c0_g1_i1.p1 TRINITY_DN63668_c0_g1~~TRINITY_DN63668_c0_g1_i1.p1  ORF type:complete len:488 (+),score=100.95 TRINITY_DN63668_c0_g1_i1:131-1465(+)